MALPAAPARAATATSTFTVTATVQASCQISTTNLNFGNYSGLQDDATSTVTISCTNTTPYSVGLNQGSGSSATVTSRKMTGPGSPGGAGATLGYSLYQDSGRTVNWGNTAGTDTEAGTGNGTAQVLTVYGRVPASEFVTPGTYTDTVVATVNF